jgi:hypothetical protein
MIRQRHLQMSTKKPRRRLSSDRVFENRGDHCGDACGQGNFAGQHDAAYEFAPEHLKA